MSNEKKQPREGLKAAGRDESPQAQPSQNSELGPKGQESVFGGNLAPGGVAFPVDQCKHPRKYKTGNEREDSRFFLWSQHQFEYYCPDCDQKIWIDEEP